MDGELERAAGCNTFMHQTSQQDAVWMDSDHGEKPELLSEAGPLRMTSGEKQLGAFYVA